MKKILFLLLLIFVASCSQTNEMQAEAVYGIEDIKSDSYVHECTEPCPLLNESCRYSLCDKTTGWKCKVIEIDNEATGECIGISGCNENLCINGECVSRELDDCDTDEPEPGYLDCGEIAHGHCSETKEGFICFNSTFVLEEDCLPELTNCEDSTLIGECSETSLGHLCNSKAELILDERCILEDIGCGPVSEGDCIEGKWCIDGELVQDDICENSCEDGTPDFSCSAHSPGYFCEEGILVEDEICNFEY